MTHQCLPGLSWLVNFFQIHDVWNVDKLVCNLLVYELVLSRCFLGADKFLSFDLSHFPSNHIRCLFWFLHIFGSHFPNLRYHSYPTSGSPSELKPRIKILQGDQKNKWFQSLNCTANIDRARLSQENLSSTVRPPTEANCAILNKSNHQHRRGDLRCNAELININWRHCGVVLEVIST